MRLEDYERPLGIRGLHGAASFDKPVNKREWWADQAKALGLSWFKLLDNGHGSAFDFARMLKDRGVTPIIRLWSDAPLPGFLDDHLFEIAKRYIQEGITKWFEVLNEPNLKLEWKPEGWDQYAGKRPWRMLEVWLAAAEKVISLGGYPAFPAMAQSGYTEDVGSLFWYQWSFKRLKETFEDRARAVFERGAWIASHDAPYNHCFKDAAGIWHFEAPYDVIEQTDHPGTGMLDGDTSLIGHLVPVYLLKRDFGLIVPVISTEGGVFVPKGHPNAWEQADTRYPGYNYQGHAERIVAMYRWLERYAATFPWYFGICPWLMANRKMGHNAPAWREDAWWHDLAGELPVINAVKEMGPPLPDPQPFDYKAWPGWDLGDVSTDEFEDPLRVLLPNGHVEIMEVEDYLKGVLPREMGKDAPLEALKAQAIAARCYARSAIVNPRHRDEGADLCTTDHCQVWAAKHYPETDRAVEETKGVIATYGGKIISAFYFGHCDGKTRKPTTAHPKPWLHDLPYTVPVDCICGYDEMYGHGVGMCQRGAMAMAEQGATYEQILWHYFQGVAVNGKVEPVVSEVEALKAEVERLKAQLEAKDKKLRIAKSALESERNTAITALDNISNEGD